ncbi:putative membrane protein [Pseudomonas cerasi]|uniref:Putative membrane protein n=1 Tax=Pseudomonas cerasi TaxID=1583341 RepID=A0A193SQS0_9PSED|nr:putative membrane protein [Pseudomonas cerasi]SOS21101.1 putative membrane protein [Pseudomonas cerasi]
MSLTTLDNLYPMTIQSPFHVTPRPSYDYVVIKNNHYIIVDVPVFLLHYAAVSPIGSAAKGVMNRLGKPSRCSRM